MSPRSPPRRPTSPRLDPDARAGLRLTLLLAGVVALGVLVLPLAVLVRDRWSPLVALDTGLGAAAHRLVLRHDGLLQAARGLTHLGAPLAVELLGGALALALLLKGYRRSALYLVVCVAGGYLLSTLGKTSVARARPVFPVAVAHAQGKSFPSGHATGAATFWLSLAVLAAPWVGARRRRWLLGGALLLGVVVASTRVLLGVHYPTDVTAGLLLGWGWVLACTAVFATWRTDEGDSGEVLEEGLEEEAEPGR